MNLSGNPVDFLLAFLGGVAASLSPCVYPLIPVSVGVITAQAGKSRARAFGLSLTYASGVALVYSTLGLIAAFTGRMFGAISTHPVTFMIAGSLMIFFGLAMLDFFSLPFLSPARLNFAGRRGYSLSFLAGLSSGLVISPCLTPMLGAILVYLATGKGVFYGAGLLLSFAYGLSLILVLAGTFSGFLAALPRSGVWMLYVKRASAAVVMIMGMYFLYFGIKELSG